MARFESAKYGAALRVAVRLRELGHAAYFAGGCVRDMLLEVVPQDFDVATDATPQQVMEMFARTEAVGAHFGVMLVIDKVAVESVFPPRLKPQSLEMVNDVRAKARTLQSEAATHQSDATTSRSEAAVLQRERIATEVATFRHDGAYSDGRRPDAVRFSADAREDVLRRDFTINGLLLDVLRYEVGDPLEDCVLDYVGGRSDLEAQIVRAIGEPQVRFAEDKLRMLRAVRFAARLGFTIEARTMLAMQAQAAEIGVVSAERVRDELTKILTEGHARRGFELLDEAGLLQQVLPEIVRMKGVEQPPQYHPEGDVWVHTLMLLEHLRRDSPGLKPVSFAGEDSGLKPTSNPVQGSDPGLKPVSNLVGGRISPTLAWGMLLHDVGKPATFTAPDPAKSGDRIRFNGHVEVGVAVARTILNRFRFSNDECEQILALVKHHMQFGDVMKMKQSTLKRFLRLPKFEEHLALHFADASSAHGDLRLYEFARAKLTELGDEQIRPVLLLTGSDLIAAGYKPGPRFREMLLTAEDAQLEGSISTKDEALALVAERFQR